jgi:hypothetical protein
MTRLFIFALFLLVGTAPALAATSANVAPSPVCLPSNVSLANAQPAHFNDQQLALLVRSYQAPEVIGLRDAIEDYLAGDAHDATAASLRDAPRASLRQRFFVISDEPQLFGGSSLLVQFGRHSDAIYSAWVYRGALERYAIRSWAKTICSAAQLRFIRVRYGDLLDKMPGA